MILFSFCAKISGMAMIVDGKKIAEEILADLRLKTDNLNFKPRLGVFLAGKNPASLSYIRTKQKMAEKIAVQTEIKKYPDDIAHKELQKEITDYASKENVCGIIVQLPLPKHISKEKILDAVPPEYDVDCLNGASRQKLTKGEKIIFAPPAAAAIVKIFEYYNVGLKNKNILLIGSGDLVGKPLASLLLRRGINFEMANRHTENLSELTKRADIVITAVGQAGLVTGEMIKEGAVVIDAGTTSSEEGEIVGDVDVKSVSGRASLLSPVPGGVGPVTVAMLLLNVVNRALGKTS